MRDAQGKANYNAAPAPTRITVYTAHSEKTERHDTGGGVSELIQLR